MSNKATSIKDRNKEDTNDTGKKKTSTEKQPHLERVKDSKLILIDNKMRGKESRITISRLGALLEAKSMPVESNLVHSQARSFADATFAVHPGASLVAVVSGTVSGVPNVRDTPPDMLRRVDLMHIKNDGEVIWNSLPSLKKPRWKCSATIYEEEDSSFCLVVGGGATNNMAANAVDVLKMQLSDDDGLIAGAQWLSHKPMNVGRHGASIAVCNNELYMFAGKSGSGCSGSLLRECEGLCLNDDSPFWLEDLPTGRHNSAIVVVEHLIILLGGSTGVKDLSCVMVYDTKENCWYSAPSLNLARTGHAATCIDGCGVLVIGGYSSSTKKSILEAEYWEFSSDSFKIIGSLPQDLEPMSRTIALPPPKGGAETYDVQHLIKSLRPIDLGGQSPWRDAKLKSLQRASSVIGRAPLTKGKSCVFNEQGSLLEKYASLNVKSVTRRTKTMNDPGDFLSDTPDSPHKPYRGGGTMEMKQVESHDENNIVEGREGGTEHIDLNQHYTKIDKSAMPPKSYYTTSPVNIVPQAGGKMIDSGVIQAELGQVEKQNGQSNIISTKESDENEAKSHRERNERDENLRRRGWRLKKDRGIKEPHDPLAYLL